MPQDIAASSQAAVLPAPVADRLAALACGIRDLPPHVVHAAKRCLIDWYAATIPGAVGAPARALEAGLADELGHGGAWTLSGRRAPMRTAALVNGTASHTVEFDDIFAPAIYHPGSPTIAAALAAAQGLCKSGSDLVAAVVAGYEVSTRVGVAMGRAHYRFWHNTGTIGTIGAAAAVGRLRGFGPDMMAEALAISTTMAAGLQQTFRGDSETKPLHAGHAADAGHVAAALAAGGVRTARDMFEGEAGLGRAMSRDVEWDAALADSGIWNITRMTVKNHGCCGHIFPALDGALTMQREHGFGAAEVARIEVGGYSATVDVTGNQCIDSAAAAKFSLPFVVASGLVHGAIRLDAFDPPRLADRAVRALMPRISVALDPEIDALFPRQRAARIVVTLADGRRIERFQPHRVGDPELPLSDEQLSDKFRELTRGVITGEAAEALLARLWAAETVPDLAFTHAHRLIGAAG
ncbi:MAG: MmgE/PrpD family protein [Alphaproteobacteria bacterium]